MRSNAEIEDRMADLRNTVSLLNSKKEQEIEKPFGQRDYRLLVFLNKETSVYEFAISQLEWLLK